MLINANLNFFELNPNLTFFKNKKQALIQWKYGAIFLGDNLFKTNRMKLFKLYNIYTVRTELYMPNG